MLNVLEDLISLARQRKEKPVDSSYTNINNISPIDVVNKLIRSRENNLQISFFNLDSNNSSNHLNPLTL